MRFTGLCGVLAALLMTGAAQAEPAFARLYKGQFGYAPSCNVCHKDGGGTPINAYGEQFKTAGMNLGAFAAIADLDADGDGAANAAESRARANPGSRRSTPDAPGDWLDTANLIPREVQALFPGITTYKPLDAIFTDAEIAAAKARGVTLTAADENTIYIPVDGRRPVGTAIIVPARHGDQQFFVLVATDRQLKVSTAQPVSTRAVPGAADPALYARFSGLTIDKLEGGDPQTLAGQVANAVRKAGTILYLRLKGA